MTNTKYITVLSVIACVFVIMLHSYTLGFEETSDWILERFIRENNYRIKLKYGAFPDRPYDSKAVWGDNKKIISILKQL